MGVWGFGGLGAWGLGGLGAWGLGGLGVSEIKRTSLGSVFTRESYYLGVYIRRPFVSETPTWFLGLGFGFPKP